MTPASCAADSAPAMSTAMLARAVRGQRPLCDHVSQRLSLHVLGCDEQVIVHLLERVDDGDGRMRDRGRRARLASEPFAQLGLHRHGGRQRLERDAAAQAHVLGQIDDAHAAATDLFENLVRADAGARQKRVEIAGIDLRGLLEKVSGRLERVEQRLGLAQQRRCRRRIPRAATRVEPRSADRAPPGRRSSAVRTVRGSRRLIVHAVRGLTIERALEPDARQRPLPLDGRG